MKHAKSTSGGRRPFRTMLSLGVGLGAMMALSAPALAQDAADDEEDDVRRLNAIEVTATRRAGTTVQDVPVAITAFDAQLLEQADFTDLTNLEQLSPGVQITTGQSASAGTAISIRGIGTGADDFGFEPAVGVFIDGVFRTRTGIAIAELPELAGVEVLRGPQGTLFGRNTSSGVVNINTAKPTFEPQVTAKVGGGNFGAANIEFSASGQVAPNHASRLDFKFRRRNGFITDVNSDNDFSDRDRFLVRFQHLWEKGDQSVRFIADFSQAQEAVGAAVQTGPVFDEDGVQIAGLVDPIIGALASIAPLTGTAPTPVVPFTTGGLSSGDDRFIGAFTPGQDFSDEIEDFGFSLEYNNDLGFANFTSITAYRNFQSTRTQDIDFGGADIANRTGTENDDQTFTQEFRLQGEKGRLDWLVGSFFLAQRIDSTESIVLGTQTDEFVDLVVLNSLPPELIGGINAALGTSFSGFQATGSLGALPAAFGGGPLDLVNGTGALSVLALLPDPVTGLPFNLSAPFIPQSDAGDGNDLDFFDLNNNAIGIFTHNVISVTDKLELTLAARYNYERKNFDVDLNTTGVEACTFLSALDPAVLAAPFLSPFIPLICNPAVNPEFDGVQGDARIESVVTGQFRFKYDVTPDFSIFGGYNRGFKAGSFNLTRANFTSSLAGDVFGVNPLSEIEFEEETVNAFELGFKSSFGNGRYTFNALGFFQDINDFQENVFNGINFITVGTQVESIGAEVDVSANPIDGLVLQGGFQFVAAERLGDTFVGTFLLAGGEQLGNIPEFTITGSATYTREIFGLEGFGHVNFRWQSAAPVQNIDGLEFLGNDAFATVGLRAGVRDLDGRWELSLFAENVADQQFIQTGFGLPIQTGGFGVFPGNPRFWGGEISVHF